MISAIMACDLKGGVGKDGSLPWPKIKEDFAHFKRTTENHVVIMGSGTWNDPLFPKPLPNRYNVVLTSKIIEGPHMLINGDLDFEIRFLEGLKKKIFLIGGERVIKENIHLVDTFHLTIFNNNFDCDKFIPLQELLKWDIVEDKAGSNNDLRFVTVRRPN